MHITARITFVHVHFVDTVRRNSFLVTPGSGKIKHATGAQVLTFWFGTTWVVEQTPSAYKILIWNNLSSWTNPGCVKHPDLEQHKSLNNPSHPWVRNFRECNDEGIIYFESPTVILTSYLPILRSTAVPFWCPVLVGSVSDMIYFLLWFISCRHQFVGNNLIIKTGVVDKRKVS